MTTAKRLLWTLCVFPSLAWAACQDAGQNDREPVVGGAADQCVAVFQGLPDDLKSTARIAPVDEPGEPLRITGTVRHQDGTPAAGVVVYAYHTNAKGIYPPDDNYPGLIAQRHGTLRNWVKTDAEGKYRFDTIRPAGYPDTQIEQHVHMHILEPGRCTYWIDSVLFDDDPRLTREMREEAKKGRGGNGLVEPTRDDDGIWHVNRDIVLGKGVPEYPPRS